jgi:hypothetical protein
MAGHRCGTNRGLAHHPGRRRRIRRAWLRGWPPARLYRAALWSLPATAVYLLAAGVQAGAWQAAAWWAALGWQHAWHELAAGRVAAAFIAVAPVAVPAGLAIAGALWARRIWAIETGLSGRTAMHPSCSTPGSGAARPAPHGDAWPSRPPSRSWTHTAGS